jgi:hypothetical protein
MDPNTVNIVLAIPTQNSNASVWDIPLNNVIESKNSVEILDHYTANDVFSGHAESEFSVVFFDATSRPHLLWDGPDHADALSQAGIFAGRLCVLFVVDRCQRPEATTNKNAAR